MNRRIAFFLPLLFLPLLTFAQVEFGLKAGISTGSLQGKSYNLFGADGREILRFDLEDSDYGFQFGALLRIPLTAKLTLQPEVTLNSAKTTFRYEDLSNSSEPRDQVFKERYNDVNVPLLLSYQLLGPLRLQAGPVGHFFVSSSGDLKEQEGIDRTFETFNMGYALGGALDLGPLTVDVRYDGNLGKYGETLQIDGNDIDIDQAPKRWIGSVAIRF